MISYQLLFLDFTLTYTNRDYWTRAKSERGPEMMKSRNTLGFENTLKCDLYPIHSAKNTFNSYVSKASIQAKMCV